MQMNTQWTWLPSFSALRGTQNPVGFAPLVVQLDSDYSWSAVLIFPISLVRWELRVCLVS